MLSHMSMVELPKGIRAETLITPTRTFEYFRQTFEDRHIIVTSFAQGYIDQIDPNELTERPSLKLIWPSGRDLGITKRSPYERFLEAGQVKGYNLLRPADALYLRDQDTEQPLNDVYWLAMKPMTDREGDRDVFGLEHDQYGMSLRAHWTDPGYLWNPEDRLVFSLPASGPEKS